MPVGPQLPRQFFIAPVSTTPQTQAPAVSPMSTDVIPNQNRVPAAHGSRLPPPTSAPSPIMKSISAKFIPRLPLAALAALAIFALQPARSATDTWSTAPGSGAWGTAGNWSDVANNFPASGDSLVFGATTITSDTDNLMTPSTYNIAGITFTASAPAYTINPFLSGDNGFTLTGGITNSSTSLETINDLITTTAVRTITLTSGGGNITLGGNISGAGGGFTTTGAGTLTLTGSNSYTAATTVGNGGTLQLQANAANTVSGTSYALGSGGLTMGGVNSSTTTLQLRSDGSLTFNGGNSLGGLGGNSGAGETVNIDVNHLTSAGLNNTLTFGPAGFSVLNTTFNVTGGNGYTLALGPITMVGGAQTDIFNPSTANLTINGFTASASGAANVDLEGSATGNSVGGAILNGSGTVAVNKLGTGAWTLSGSNSYTGATTLSAGTLVLAANSGNTVSGVSLALSNSSSALTLSANTTLELLGNTNNTIFEPANTGGATSLTTGVVEATASSGPFNFFAGNNGSGTGNTLILGNFGEFGAGSTTPTFNFASANGYNLQIGSGSAGTGALEIYNNTTINSNTAGSSLLIPGGIAINFGAGYTMTFSGAGNTTVGTLTTSSTYSLNVTKTGSGTLTLNGAAEASNTAAVTLNGGTITLDFSTGAATNNILSSTDTMTWDFGTLNINSASSGANGQTFGAITLQNGGLVNVNAVSNGSGAATLTLGAITRTANVNTDAAGGVIRFGTTGTIVLSGNTASSILLDSQGNPYATVGLNDWAATNAAGVVITATAGVAYTDWTTSTSINGVSPAAVAFSNNTTTGPITITNSNTSTLRGILVSSTSAGGTLTGGFVRPNRNSGLTAGAQFLVVQNSTLGDLTIGSSLSIGSSSTPVSLVKAGAGRLILTSAANAQSRDFIDEGTLDVSADANLGTVAGGDLVFDGGTLEVSSGYTEATARAHILNAPATIRSIVEPIALVASLAASAP